MSAATLEDRRVGYDIALIGAGAKGGAIGTRLIEMGHRLHVFDRARDRVEAMVGLGTVAAGSAAEAAGAAEFVVLSLNTAQVVESAVFGTGGVAEGTRDGTLSIDMSSIDPTATRTLAERSTARGLAWVDSPLSGGPPKALIGELTLMAGGSP